MNRCDVQFFVTSHGMNQQFVSEVVSDWKVIGFVGGSGIVFVSKTTNAKEDDSTRAENLVFLVTAGLNAAIGISVKHNLVVQNCLLIKLSVLLFLLISLRLEVNIMVSLPLLMTYLAFQVHCISITGGLISFIKVSINGFPWRSFWLKSQSVRFRNQNRVCPK